MLLRTTVACYSRIALLIGVALYAQQDYGATKLNLRQLVEESDVVAVVNIQASEATGTPETSGKDASPGARSYIALAKLRHAIKGNPPDSITVHYVLSPESLHRAVATGYRLVFLHGTDGHFEFTDPVDPALPATSSDSTLSRNEASSTPPVNQVMQVLADVIASPDASDQDKESILMRSYAIPRDFAPFMVSLRSGLRQTSDPVLQARITSALLQRGDLSQLGSARRTLSRTDVTEEQRDLLLHAISKGVRDTRAAPELQLLLASDDVQLRRAGAEALWHSAARSSVPALIKALDDSDQDIRYFAVRGLAEVTGKQEWGPTTNVFKDNEHHYLSQWKKWSKNQ
jgi:hypothetical protein